MQQSLKQKCVENVVVHNLSSLMKRRNNFSEILNNNSLSKNMEETNRGANDRKEIICPYYGEIKIQSTFKTEVNENEDIELYFDITRGGDFGSESENDDHIHYLHKQRELIDDKLIKEEDVQGVDNENSVIRRGIWNLLNN